MKFQIFALFELFYCKHRTFPHKLRYAVNATIPTTSFSPIFFSQMTSFAVHYDVIYQPFPINSQYMKTWGLTALSFFRLRDLDVLEKDSA